MLVTVERYQSVTGDNDSPTADVGDALADAQALLEERLDRELEEGERTERCYPRDDGRLYPRVTPLISAPGYNLDGDVVLSAFGWPDFIIGTEGVDVTYTGGFVERTANSDATNRLPLHVERDVCLAAFALLHVPVTTVAVGGDALATSRSMGDASVSHSRPVPTGTAAQIESCWSRETLRLARPGRRV